MAMGGSLESGQNPESEQSLAHSLLIELLAYVQDHRRWMTSNGTDRPVDINSPRPSNGKTPCIAFILLCTLIMAGSNRKQDRHSRCNIRPEKRQACCRDWPSRYTSYDGSAHTGHQVRDKRCSSTDPTSAPGLIKGRERDFSRA